MKLNIKNPCFFRRGERGCGYHNARDREKLLLWGGMNPSRTRWGSDISPILLSTNAGGGRDHALLLPPEAPPRLFNSSPNSPSASGLRGTPKLPQSFAFVLSEGLWFFSWVSMNPSAFIFWGIFMNSGPSRLLPSTVQHQYVYTLCKHFSILHYKYSILHMLDLEGILKKQFHFFFHSHLQVCSVKSLFWSLKTISSFSLTLYQSNSLNKTSTRVLCGWTLSLVSSGDWSWRRLEHSLILPLSLVFLEKNAEVKDC